jgi:PAS domain S-box-containing protein
MLIQEDYFKNIFNTVREGILVLDENMRVLSANRSFFNIFKVDTASTIGFLLYDLGNGQWNIPTLRVLLEDILPKNDTVDDYKIEHKFQSIGHKTMLLNACKIIKEKNGPPIILLAIEDLTERKRLEDLITESEVRYKRLFETANDGILLLEKSEGTVSQANPAAEKMLGYSKEEYIGKNLQDLGVSLDMSDFPTIMGALNKSGIIYYDDVLVKTKSGPNIYTDIYMVDKATLAQCNIRDITERKKSEESLLAELETINRELESFIYSVSHDLRGPLRAIFGFSSIMMKDIANKLEDKEKRYLSLIHDGTEKMSRLIDDLLNLSSISRQEIQRREVNVSSIAASIVVGLREAHPDRSVEVDIKEGLTVLADPGLIEIVLSNLLENAWKFTAKAEHARIELGTVKQDGKIIYYVRDNGAGFDQKYAGKMFWPFHRLHSEAEFEGIGIGLAIVDRIIRRHGGKVWAEGTEGKGATIYFGLS